MNQSPTIESIEQLFTQIPDEESRAVLVQNLAGHTKLKTTIPEQRIQEAVTHLQEAGHTEEAVIVGYGVLPDTELNSILDTQISLFESAESYEDLSDFLEQMSELAEKLGRSDEEKRFIKLGIETELKMAETDETP